jgi:hypothetical protein
MNELPYHLSMQPPCMTLLFCLCAHEGCEQKRVYRPECLCRRLFSG